MPVTTIQDLKYAWFKAHAVTPGPNDTVDDLEFNYLRSLGFTGTIADMRRQKWAPTGYETVNDAEYRVLKAAVGTAGKLESINDLRWLYYAGP